MLSMDGPGYIARGYNPLSRQPKTNFASLVVESAG
jgi:hypothetical protein